jgi:hypothetical protein
VVFPFAIAAAASAASAIVTQASPARADDFFEGTRSEKLVEKSHVIELRMDRGHAELVVRRTVWNGGPRHDQAVFHLDVPMGAVATGLRTLGMKDGKPFWFKGDLMEAEAAAKKYQELTGIGVFYPKDPALLSWRRQSRLALQVFPVPPSEPKTVEYTLKVPTSYSEGRHRLTLPQLGTEKVRAEAVIRPAHAEDTLFVDGRPAGVGMRIKLDKEAGVEIALARGGAPQLEGALAMVPFAQGRALVSYHVEAAARLAEVPRRANVVVLLDASRSFTHDGAQELKEAALAYLSHYKDAKVEIMTFNRRAYELFGAFEPVEKARLELEKLVIERGNGSAVDDALARADAKLAKAPPGSAKRILLLTDLRTRSQLSPELARGRLGKSGALIHIGVVGSSSRPPVVVRDDDHPWDKVTRPTGGLVWQAGVSASFDKRAAMKEAFEELARPMRIDRVKVSAPGLSADDLAVHPTVLDEGQGLESSLINAKQVPWVEVKGELWSTPIRRVIVPDEAEGRLRSALVFGSRLLDQLTEAEMMPLAIRGQAVSPVTSYLAIEPGVRPSTEGLEVGGGGSGGLGTTGFGAGSGRAGHGMFTSTNHLTRILRDSLAASWKACGGGSSSISVDIETTFREIVDVRMQRSVPPAPDAERCLEEAAWAIDLPGIFTSSWIGFSIQI